MCEEAHICRLINPSKYRHTYIYMLVGSCEARYWQALVRVSLMTTEGLSGWRCMDDLDGSLDTIP